MLTDPPSSYEFIFFNKWKKTKFFHAIAYISNFSYGFVMLDQSFVYPMFLVKALLRYSSSRMAGTILLFFFFFLTPLSQQQILSFYNCLTFFCTFRCCLCRSPFIFPWTRFTPHTFTRVYEIV